MQQFSYRHNSLNKAYLYNKGRYLVYDTEMNQLLQEDLNIISTLPEDITPNDLHDSSLFEEFRFDPSYYSFIGKKGNLVIAPSFSLHIFQQDTTTSLHDK